MVAIQPFDDIDLALTRRLLEGSREIGLAGEAERQRCVHQGPIAMDQ
jgi:hypothetical protein